MFQPYNDKYAYDRAKHGSTIYSCIRNNFAWVCESPTHAKRDRWRSRRQPSSTLPRYIYPQHIDSWSVSYLLAVDVVAWIMSVDTFRGWFLRLRSRNALFDLLFQWIFEVNWIYILMSGHEYNLMRLFWTQIIFIGVSKAFWLNLSELFEFFTRFFDSSLAFSPSGVWKSLQSRIQD